MSSREISLSEVLVEGSSGVGTSWMNYRVLGATRAGLALAKEPVGKSPERYKLVEPWTIFYNPMRILLGSIAMVEEGEDPGITSPDYVVFRTRPGILHPRWFYYWLRSDQGADLIRSLTRGAVRERLLFKRLAKGSLRIPHWDAQLRAAEQLAVIEKARVAATAQKEAAKALPAAYLREVFESAEARKWPLAELGSLAIAVQNGIYKPPEFYGHGATFVRMYNIPNASWSLCYETLAQVEVSEAEQDRFGLQPGDLLVSRVNSFELVGKCAHVDGKSAGFVFENMLIRVRLSERVNPLFMAQQMSTGSVRSQIQRVAKRAIGQASINSDDIRQVRLAVPPRQVQNEVSQYVEKKVVSARELEATVEATEKAISLAPGAVLNSVFGGGA
jgi:type I restriction enzyme S subunit